MVALPQGSPLVPVLKDPFDRPIEYLRLSVTDRCDLRCGYCLPKGFKGFEEPEHWLDFDEIARVVSAFVRLGVRHVRLTGGEPLVRRDLPVLGRPVGRPARTRRPVAVQQLHPHGGPGGAALSRPGCGV